MGPLSLTASILGITSACLKSAHLLDGLRERYKHAQVTMSALCAEATTISAFLSQIQSLVLANQCAIVTQLRSRTDIVATFDTALTGCSIVVAVLNDEIATLVTEGSENDVHWRQKAMLAWKDNTMKDLLQQLRGQSSAIGLLRQALNAESISGIRDLLQQNSLLLERVARRTRSLRDTHPNVVVRSSILIDDVSEIGSMADTVQTGVSDSTFVFDDLIVDSKVYRRALAHATSKIKLSLKHEKDDIWEGSGETADIERGGAKRHWAHIIQDFCLSVEEDSVFQEAKRRLKERSDFKDFEEELQAVKAWFLVLDLDERKYSLEALANADKVKISDTRGWRISGNFFDPEPTVLTQNEPPPGWI